MADLKYIVGGDIAFAFSVLVILALEWIMPALIDTLTMEGANTIQAIVWLGTIIIYAVLLLVIPLALKVYGLSGEKENPVILLAGGIIYALFIIAVAYFSWFMLTAIAGHLVSTLAVALFWAGAALNFVFDIIVVPGYAITQARED